MLPNVPGIATVTDSRASSLSTVINPRGAQTLKPAPNPAIVGYTMLWAALFFIELKFGFIFPYKFNIHSVQVVFVTKKLLVKFFPNKVCRFLYFL